MRRRGFMSLLWFCASTLAVQAAMTDVRGAERKEPQKEERKAEQKGDQKGDQKDDSAGMNGGKGTKNNVFGSKNWKPAPPPKKVMKVKPVAAPSMPVAAPPPPPAPPPLPYAYIGRMIDGETTIIFLGNQQRSLAVKAGDTIDNVYRVERISDSGMTLVYLPLNASQQMSFGGIR